jgi:hypothetical protein
MKKKGIDYLLELLAETIDASGRSDRDIERALEVSHGWLRLLLKGNIDLKVKHVAEIGAELGFSLEDFFLRAYGKGGSLEKGRLTVAPSVESVKGKRGEKPRTQSHLSAAARLEIRGLIHEELSKLHGEPSENEEDEGEKS